jgi:hypothetical protein
MNAAQTDQPNGTKQATNSTGQSPWEADRHSASQEIPCCLWNPPATGPCPEAYSDIYFSKIHFNIILPYVSVYFSALHTIRTMWLACSSSLRNDRHVTRNGTHATVTKNRDLSLETRSPVPPRIMNAAVVTPPAGITTRYHDVRFPPGVILATAAVHVATL